MLPAGTHILHLITRLDAGGSATNTAMTCLRLCACPGLKVTLAYGPSPDLTPDLRQRLAAEPALRQVELPALVRDPAPGRDLRALLQVARLLRRERPQILHTHTSKAGLLGRWAGRALRVPWIVHTPHGHVFYGYFGSLRTRVFVGLERTGARCCHRIVSLTDRETEESLALRIGRPEQYRTIPSGVPLDAFMRPPGGSRERVRQELGIPAGALVALSVGRLEPIKGFDILLAAWAQLAAPRPSLLLAGDGAERPRLEALVAAGSCGDRVRFLGARDDVPALLAAADLFVLASRNEGMGRAFVEAMAAGLPVIGTDVGGVRTFVRDGENGFLVPPEDPTALARAVSRIATLAPAARQALGAAGRTTVVPAYSEDTMVARILEVYDEGVGQISVHR